MFGLAEIKAMNEAEKPPVPSRFNGLYLPNKSDKLKTDLTSQLIAYEQNELNEEQKLNFFQRLVNTGIVWKLQEHYGRIAHSLLKAGLIKLRKG